MNITKKLARDFQNEHFINLNENKTNVKTHVQLTEVKESNKEFLDINNVNYTTTPIETIKNSDNNYPSQYDIEARSNSNNNINVSNNQGPIIVANNHIDSLPNKPFIIVDSYMKYNTEPTLGACPYCKEVGLTVTKKKVNIPSVLCCLAIGPLLFMAAQKLRSKDINVMNVDHHCNSCGKLISKYSSC